MLVRSYLPRSCLMSILYMVGGAQKVVMLYLANMGSSMGRPVPLYPVDLVDGEGNSVPDGQVGEIVISVLLDVGLNFLLQLLRPLGAGHQHDAGLHHLAPHLVRRGGYAALIPSYDLVLVDADGQPAAPGENGEICIRAEEGKAPCGLFSGYFRDEEQTKGVWHDGLYHTRDGCSSRTAPVTCRSQLVAHDLPAD